MVGAERALGEHRRGVVGMGGAPEEPSEGERAEASADRAQRSAARERCRLKAAAVMARVVRHRRNTNSFVENSVWASAA